MLDIHIYLIDVHIYILDGQGSVLLCFGTRSITQGLRARMLQYLLDLQ